MNNPFFENKGPFNINEILANINSNNNINHSNKNILDVKDLFNATNEDLSLIHI